MKKLLFVALAAILLHTSCTKEKIVTKTVTETVTDTVTVHTQDSAEYAGKTVLSFDAVIGAQDFALNVPFTIAGRKYTFDKLRYWVSDVVLIDEAGVEFKVPNAYYLLEETNALSIQDGAYTYPANKRENVIISNIPVGTYSKIRFSIGVDAAHNDNLSLQSGELSQLNGMTNISWMWHTSYIFTALQGTVTEGATDAKFVAETGMNDNYRTLTLNLPNTVRLSTSNTDSEILLKVDIAQALSNLDLIATPKIGAAQVAEMTTLADNYATKVFTVQSAK